MNQSLLSNIFQWGTSATHSDTDISIWLYGLAFVLILSFLWSTVVKDVLREA